MISLLLCLPITAFSQVGIGTSTPHTSAQLQVGADANNTKGFLPPRVSLTATDVAGPVSTPATGLLVYNTATAGTSPNNVTPGFYYYDGSKWQRIINQQPDATISFNQNTPTTSGVVFTPNTPNSTDYIYVSSTNNSQWTWNGSAYVTYTPPASTPWYLSTGTSDAGSNKTGSIYRSGNVGINASNPTDKLVVGSAFAFHDGGNEVIGLAYSPGNSNAALAAGYPAEIRLETNTGNLQFGTDPTSRTAGAAAGVQKRMTITKDGAVGIGTTSPSSRLHTYQADGTNDNQLLLEQGSNGRASGMTLRGADDAGSSWNFISSQTGTGTDMWRIGGGGVANTLILSTAGSERMRVASDGKVGIGTNAPGTALHVVSGTSRGAFRLVDGSQGPGKVLTSDANGNAQWETGAFVLYSEVHSNGNAGVDYNSSSGNVKFTGFNQVVADNVVTTYGSSYGWDNTNKRWVAPRNGKYRITTNAYLNHNPSFLNPRLYAFLYNANGSGGTICNILSATTSGSDLSTSTSAIISMTTGQYIEWVVPSTYSAKLYLALYHTFMRIESVE